MNNISMSTGKERSYSN